MKKFTEKLISRLKEQRNDANKWCESDDDYFSGKEYAYETAISIVNQLAEEYQGGWIPCSERMPERVQNVLVNLEDEDCVIAHVEVLSGLNVWINSSTDQRINLDVIAWQPLPEPYHPEPRQQYTAQWKERMLNTFLSRG